ncbi:MAG: VWA domain-containing protein [Planctomycetota bacterium]
MPYSAEISRTNPSCFLFVVDQSASMEDMFGADGETKAKADGVADAINRLLQDLVIKCAKSEGVRDYYHIGVIGYGADVGPAFSGDLLGQDIVPVSEIAEHPARVEERVRKVDDGAGGLVEQTVKFPIWFDATANGGTPMCAAFTLAQDILGNWLDEHPKAFPPVVIHITDGESTDGDPTEMMQKLRSMQTKDGNVLLFNVHLSDNPNAQTLSFPDDVQELPDQYAQTLFQGSSPLTPFMRRVAGELGFDVSDETRGFVLNADLPLVVQALEIGTRPSNLR